MHCWGRASSAEGGEVSVSQLGVTSEHVCCCAVPPWKALTSERDLCRWQVVKCGSRWDRELAVHSTCDRHRSFFARLTHSPGNQSRVPFWSHFVSLGAKYRFKIVIDNQLVLRSESHLMRKKAHILYAFSTNTVCRSCSSPWFTLTVDASLVRALPTSVGLKRNRNEWEMIMVIIHFGLLIYSLGHHYLTSHEYIVHVQVAGKCISVHFIQDLFIFWSLSSCQKPNVPNRP